MSGEQDDELAIEAAARIVQAAGLSKVFAQVAPLIVSMRTALIDAGMTAGEADRFAAIWLVQVVKGSSE